jgi:hypothetical protein
MSGRTHGTTRRLLSALIAVTVFLLALPLAFVSAADHEDYTAGQIEDWLVDKIGTSTVTVTTPPSVTLDQLNGRMIVEDFTFQVCGIAVGLSELRLSFNGADTSVAVAGELDVLGKNPRFWCDLVVECTDTDGIPRVTGISNVKVADYEPALSTEDLDTIAEKLNCIIEASEVSIGSPGAELVSIDVVNDAGAKVELSWSDPKTTLHDASSIQQAASDAADTLAGKANSYLEEGPGQWSVDVLIADGLLQIDCEASFCGITVGLEDFDVDFDTLNASVTDATVYIGTATKEATFSAEGDIAVSGGIPSITMTDLTMGNEHPGLRDFVADIESALLDAIDQAVDSAVEDAGLEFRFATVDDIAVVDSLLRLTQGATRETDIERRHGRNAEEARLKQGGEAEEANMSVCCLNIDPLQVLPNQEVTISADVCNQGGERGSKTVALMINGQAEQSQTVSVSPGACQQVTFRVSRAVPGTYQVSVDGMVGQFSVLGTKTVTENVPTEQEPGIGTAGIIAIVVVIIVLIVGIVVIFKKD